jgi:hypothetical protein
LIVTSSLPKEDVKVTWSILADELMVGIYKPCTIILFPLLAKVVPV